MDTKYKILIVFAAFAISCSLEEQPIDFIQKGDFYKTDKEVIMSVNAAYSNLAEKNYYGQKFTCALWCSTDFGDGTSGANTSEQFAAAQLTSSHLWLVDIWASIYNGINKANLTIANTENNDNISEDLRCRVVGEARFLRALHYFNLIRCFGAVPLRVTPATPDDTSTPLSDYKNIFAQIISDLKYAETNCWDRGEKKGDYTNDIGRVTNLAATALLAKVYLHIASSARVANTLGFTDGTYTDINSPYKTFENYRNYYDSCMVKCREGLVHKDFSLEEDWSDLWSVDNRNSQEVLFAVQYSTSPGYGNQLPYLFLPKQSVLGGSRTSTGSNFRMLPHFLNTGVLYQDNDFRFNNGCVTRIDFVDGSPSEEWVINAKMKGAYKIVGTGAKGTGGGSDTKLCISKWNDPNTQDINSSSCNLPILRSVDFYLMLAEAAAEFYEDPSVSYEYINAARLRLSGAQVVDHAYIQTLDGDSDMEKFRNFIVRERLQEFLGENDRYFTLLRMGKLISETDKVVAQGNAKKLRTPDNYTWPLSIDELESNKSLNQ